MLIKKAIDFPEGDEKNLVALICNHMKKDYMSWNKDTVDDRKIADDLAEPSGGKLQMTGQPSPPYGRTDRTELSAEDE